MARKKYRSFFNTQFVTTCLSTMLVLVLLGTIVLFVLSAQNLSTYVRENINISVLINDEMDSLHIQNLKASFEKAEYVKELQYISKEEALQEECAAQGTDPSEFLGFNPYTASFEIKVKGDHATNEGMDKIVKSMKATPGVIDVIYSKDLIKAVNDTDVVTGGSKIEGVVDQTFFCCCPEFVFQGLHGHCLRHAVWHVKHGCHTTGSGGPAFGGHIGLMCQTGITEMHMVVNDAG